MSEAGPSPRWWPVLLGGLGGASWALVDVLVVVTTGRLFPGPFSVAALVALDVGALAAVAAVSIGVVGQIPALRRAPAVWAWLGGLAVAFVLAFGERWFSDPPPFQEPFPFQGNPLVFLLLGIVLPALVVAGAAWLARRSHVGVAGGSAALMVAGAAAVVAMRTEGPAEAPPPAEPRPNVLLVTLDTTRADRFGAYPIDTSAYDRVAAEGARFDLAMSHIPVTGPSHGSILSGRPPWENNMLLNGELLGPDVPWFPQALAASGYDTAGFVSAWVLLRDMGFDRGFHVYDDDFGWVKGLDAILVGRLIEMVKRRRDGAAYLLERRGDHTVDDALHWLDARDGDRPWFAWVHLFDAHGPYLPPQPFDTRYYAGADPKDPTNKSMEAAHEHMQPYLRASLRGITDTAYVKAMYDGEVAYADAQLARLLTWLDDSGAAANTIVVVTADHGEGLGERGEWFDHGDWLYEHDLHVPLAIRYPGHIKPGTVIGHPVELADLTPTLADYAGVPLDGTTGVSLRASIEQNRAPHLLARSMCFDRQPNRDARAQDPTFKPKWRQAGLRGPRDRYLERDAPEYLPIYFRCDSAGCEEADDIDVTLADLFEKQAQELLSAQLGERREKSEAEADLLEALGYVDP
jgi:arylsulfatase A-like enzyme